MLKILFKIFYKILKAKDSKETNAKDSYDSKCLRLIMHKSKMWTDIQNSKVISHLECLAFTIFCI